MPIYSLKAWVVARRRRASSVSILRAMSGYVEIRLRRSQRVNIKQ